MRVVAVDGRYMLKCVAALALVAATAVAAPPELRSDDFLLQLFQVWGLLASPVRPDVWNNVACAVSVQRMDMNGDERLDTSEATSYHLATGAAHFGVPEGSPLVLGMADADGDGSASLEEFKTRYARLLGRTVGASAAAGEVRGCARVPSGRASLPQPASRFPHLSITTLIPSLLSCCNRCTSL
jgi:hypothetical protein